MGALRRAFLLIFGGPLTGAAWGDQRPPSPHGHTAVVPEKTAQPGPTTDLLEEWPRTGPACLGHTRPATFQ